VRNDDCLLRGPSPFLSRRLTLADWRLIRYHPGCREVPSEASMTSTLSGGYHITHTLRSSLIVVNTLGSIDECNPPSPFLVLGAVEPDIESISGLWVIKSMKRECQKWEKKCMKWNTIRACSTASSPRSTCSRTCPHPDPAGRATRYAGRPRH